MYDPRTEPREFVAADRAQAVAKACQFFDASEEELAIAEVAQEIGGLGGRVVVVARPRSAARQAPPRGEARAPRGEARAPREPQPRRAEVERRAPVQREGEQEGPSQGNRLGELSALGEFVCGAVERMDLGPFEFSESEEDDLLVLLLKGPAAVGLTAGDGRAVDAIQLLANQAAMRAKADAPRVVVDVEGDREARGGYLERLAERAARRAMTAGRAVALDPMNPKDRRVVHIALRGVRDVATMSTGSGRYRQVVVVPREAPEYDEAVRYSEAATRDDA